MDDIQKIDDYSVNLLLLVEQYKDSTNLRGMIDSMNDLADQLEDALFEIRNLFYLETAEGVQLDIIGSIFGVEREGANDTEYRIKIKVKAGLVGSGEPEFIISVLKSLYGATFVNYVPNYPGEPGAYTVFTDAVITETELNIFSPSGVKGYIGGFLLLESGDFLLLEDGISKLII